MSVPFSSGLMICAADTSLPAAFLRSSLWSELLAGYLILVHTLISDLEIVLKLLALFGDSAEPAQTGTYAVRLCLELIIAVEEILDILYVALNHTVGIVAASDDSVLVTADTGADLVVLAAGIKSVCGNGDSSKMPLFPASSSAQMRDHTQPCRV